MYFTEDRPVTLDRSFDSSFTKTQHLKDFYEDRLGSLSKQLQVFFAELDSDEIFKAMRENSLSREFAIQRASELFSEIMKSEQEAFIYKQQTELAEYKSAFSKLEFDKQKLVNTKSELEDKLRKIEIDRDRLMHELKIANNKLDETEFELEESIKRKDLEWMQKLDLSMRKMEDRVQDTEQRYLSSRKELESINGVKKSAEHLAAELESLRRQMKNQENSHYREIDQMRSEYEGKISELEKSCESIANQYKGYQKQNEDLASSQQSVIKNLMEKSKQLKQKIISQKNRLQDFSKLSKESSVNLDATRSNYEKAIIELEDRIKHIQKESMNKENELAQKHQSQIIQLQGHYQQMMDAKLSEMQREVDEQVKKSQDHDREVRNLMDLKMREIEKDYILRVLHEKSLIEKEAFLAKKFSEKMENFQMESEKVQNELQSIIDEHAGKNEELVEKVQNLQDELLREKERLGSDLNSKLLKLKDCENSKTQLLKDLEKTKRTVKELQDNYEQEMQNRLKADRELINLQSDFEETKLDLTQTKQNLKVAKHHHDQLLTEKVDKTEYLQASEKIEIYRKELEKKIDFINCLQDEVNSLESNLRELKGIRINEAKQLEVEIKRHSETKTQVKDLEGYSENLLSEIEYRDKKLAELKVQTEGLKDEIRRLNRDLEEKNSEIFSFKQTTLTREAETRTRLQGSLGKLKKYVKSTTFYLKKQLSSLAELIGHEYLSITKHFSTLSQEISIKIIELELKYRKQTEQKSDQYGSDIKSYYRERLAQVEEFIVQENIHWNDSETEGIRRAVKNLIEKKHIGQIEIKSLRESVNKLTEQNENFYRENQKLQIRLHANNEAFDQLQREVTEEANKIKMKLDSGKDRVTDRGEIFRNFKY